MPNVPRGFDTGAPAEDRAAAIFVTGVGTIPVIIPRRTSVFCLVDSSGLDSLSRIVFVTIARRADDAAANA